jgi:hypothetical protein
VGGLLEQIVQVTELAMVPEGFAVIRSHDQHVVLGDQERLGQLLEVGVRFADLRVVERLQIAECRGAGAEIGPRPQTDHVDPVQRPVPGGPSPAFVALGPAGEPRLVLEVGIVGIEQVDPHEHGALPLADVADQRLRYRLDSRDGLEADLDPVVEALGEAPLAGQVPIGDEREGLVPALFQLLRQRRHVVGEPRATETLLGRDEPLAVEPDLVREAPRDDRSHRRDGPRRGGLRRLEHRPAAGHAVEPGSGVARVAIRRQVVGADRVDGEQEEVGRALRRGRRTR